TNLPGDRRRQRDPVLALHVDDTLVGFRSGQRLDREAHLGMLGLGHLVQGCEEFQDPRCIDDFYRNAHPSCPPALDAYYTLFLWTCAGKTRRRPARTVSGLLIGRPWGINIWLALPVRQQTTPAKTSFPPVCT